MAEGGAETPVMPHVCCWLRNPASLAPPCSCYLLLERCLKFPMLPH